MGPTTSDIRAVLRVFARLAAPASRPATVDVARSGDPVAWLGESPWRDVEHQSATTVVRSSPELRRLAAIDALAPEATLLRVGWYWLVGTTSAPPGPDGSAGEGPTRVLVPLLVRPVRIVRVGLTALAPLGDVELTPLVTDPDERRRLDPALLTAASSATLAQWWSDASAAAGLAVDGVVDVVDDASAAAGRDRLVLWPGAAVFASREDMTLDMGAVLRTWVTRADVEASALAHLYVPPPRGVAPDRPAPPPLVATPLPLDAEQLEVLRHARTHPVTIVSGAPGTGKSHTVVAAAIDAVAQGQSVLVATQSERASDVLAELLRRHPGPTPVLFGSSARRDDVATELSSGLGVAMSSAEVTQRRRAVEEAAGRVAWIERAIALLLSREEVAARATTQEALVAALQLEVPGAFDGATDLDRARRLLDVLARPEAGWFDRRHRRKAVAELTTLLGLEGEPDVAQIAMALDVAAGRRAEIELDAIGGTTVGGLWDDLERADAALRGAIGAFAADSARGAAALDMAARSAVAALASALRSGRERRRVLLERVDGSDLLRALPLWVGTLRDIEELLPATAGLFDLVILDEASQIDQLRAVSALARARRAMVVGDPRQLRHVSFLSDGAVAEAIADEELGELAGVLDVRRNSVFDAAAAAHGVIELVEEHRAAPHLIRFPIERFYRRDLQLATRHPVNEARDCIDVVRVQGRRDGDRVNRAEVDEVVAQLVRLSAAGTASIGVITPFRPQADAVTAAVLDRWDAEEIAEMGLRVGTVHEFQGSERDVMVLTLGITDDASASTRRFVEDPHLFNVLVTRAREQMVVVTSLVTPPPGLVADWLAQADLPPAPPPDGDPGSPWAAEVADVLDELGVRVRRGYPVGRWRVDLAIGDGARAVAVECAPHPDGPDAHLERHRALRRAGWRVVDAFPTRFGHRAAEAAIGLADEVAGQLDR